MDRQLDRKFSSRLQALLAAMVAVLALFMSGCSKSQYSFAYMNVTETFPARDRTETISTVTPKTRILFVEDNSGSMAFYQGKLTAGLGAWTSTYLKAQYDIAMASITTDTFQAGWQGIDATAYGDSTASCLSRLVPGVHDGLIPNVADGIAGAFGLDCALTAAATAQITANGDRSLRPILTTQPPAGTAADTAYLTQLVNDFYKNHLPGTSGNGSERGFQSFYQFVLDNESRSECQASPASDPSCFFPHYDPVTSIVPPLNIVVFLSDEHDHSATDFGTGTFINHSEGAITPLTDAQMRQAAQPEAQAFKSSMDKFFLSLAQGTSTDPHYAVMAIVNATCNSNLDTACGLPARPGANRDVNERWGIEYATLVDMIAGYAGDSNRQAQPGDPSNQLGKYSQIYDINQSDYSPLFTFIGNQIANQTKTVNFSKFSLTNTAAGVDSTRVTLKLSNGQQFPLPSAWISFDQNYNLLIADQFQSMIPAGDAGAMITVEYYPQCYGHCAMPVQATPTATPSFTPPSPVPGGGGNG